MEQPKFKDFKQQSIERQNALTNAITYCMGRPITDNVKAILETAETFYLWTSTGAIPNEKK